MSRRGRTHLITHYPMFRYRLLTLLIVLALGPPLLAGGYSAGVRYVEWRERQNEIKRLNARFAPKNSVLAIGGSSELNIWPDREEPQMFRFTIRNVLWLTFGVAVALGMWWYSRQPKPPPPSLEVFTVEEYVGQPPTTLNRP